MTISLNSPNPDRATLSEQVHQYLSQGGTITKLPSSLTSATSEAAHLTRYNAAHQIKRMRTAGHSWAVIAKDMQCTHAEAKQLWKEFD